jgi:hypothetical protein
MDEAQFAEAAPWRRWVIGLLCAVFSLPWHYILWVSVYSMIRDRDLPTGEVVYVLAAVACAAYILTRWSYLLFRGPRGRARLLNNAFLWFSAFVMVGLALVGLTATPPNLRATTHFGVLAVSACLLALARRRKERGDAA